jgi:predicted  nucleic acid-binding Zn-ribbon protein
MKNVAQDASSAILARLNAGDDFSKMTQIEIGNYVRDFLEGKKAEAATRAATSISNAETKRAALETFDANLAQLAERRQQIEVQIEEQRRARGEALADGADTKAVEKQIRDLRDESERLEDQIAALHVRRPQVERDMLISQYEAKRDYADAFGEFVTEFSRAAEIAKSMWGVTLAIAEQLRLNSPGATVQAYQQLVVQHKIKHPHVYQDLGGAK